MFWGQSFIVVLVVVATAAQDASGGVKKCKRDGDYCQNHWECCSNSCLSYLYKCVETNNLNNKRPQGASSFEPSYGVSSPSYNAPSMSLQNLIDLLFGPGAQVQNNVQSQQPPNALEPTCKSIGSQCQRNSECCTNVCHESIYQCVKR